MKRFLVALAFLLPFYSQAQVAPPSEEDTQAQEAFYISGLLGYSHIDLKEFSFEPEIGFGVRFGFLFSDHFSLGIYTQRYSSSASNTQLDAKDWTFGFEFTNLMIEFNYYVNEFDEDGFWFGALLGATKMNPTEAKFRGTSMPFINNTTYETSFGVSGGYHFTVATHFSIDPQINYIYTSDDGNVLHQFSGLVNFTFWIHI